jgi:hypothetical protein
MSASDVDEFAVGKLGAARDVRVSVGDGTFA